MGCQSPMTTSLSDAVQQTERALLGSILEQNSLWAQTDGLSVEDFSLDSHRRIYSRMACMFEEQQPVDIRTLTLELAKQNQLAACGDSAYLVSVQNEAYPPNFSAYVRQVSEAAQERHYSRLCEKLVNATENDVRGDILQRMRDELIGNNRCDWRALFHTREEIEKAPPLRFAIDGFLQEEGITLIGGLA